VIPSSQKSITEPSSAQIAGAVLTHSVDSNQNISYGNESHINITETIPSPSSTLSFSSDPTNNIKLVSHCLSNPATKQGNASSDEDIKENSQTKTEATYNPNPKYLKNVAYQKSYTGPSPPIIIYISEPEDMSEQSLLYKNNNNANNLMTHTRQVNQSGLSPFSPEFCPSPNSVNDSKPTLMDLSNATIKEITKPSNVIDIKQHSQTKLGLDGNTISHDKPGNNIGHDVDSAHTSPRSHDAKTKLLYQKEILVIKLSKSSLAEIQTSNRLHTTSPTSTKERQFTTRTNPPESYINQSTTKLCLPPFKSNGSIFFLTNTAYIYIYIYINKQKSDSI
jgi:hypothetical protein